MKKILLLGDGDHFPQGAYRFLKNLRENEPVFVKGLFFTPVDTEQMITISFMPVAAPLVKLRENEEILVHKSQDTFTAQCEKDGIKYQVHPYEGTWDRELFIRESRFADLVVVSEELFCLDSMNRQPSFFMEEMLRASESPVVVVPENFIKMDRLAVAYDGGRESMIALKQFVYLFPHLTDLPADFVHVKKEAGDRIPERELLQEYCNAHFDSLYASKLQFDPRKYFSTWLENKKMVLLITGSYSRSSFSNLLKKSFAGDIISKHTCPVFIAH